MAKTQLKERGLYGEILRGAFEIMWHRRELWLLGLLASLLMMNGGAFEFIVRAIYKISGGAPYAGGPQFVQALLDGIGSAESTTQISIFFTVILMAAIFALVAIIAVAASGGLLAAAARRAMKKKMTMRGAFGAGMDKLGPLLLTQILGRTAIFAAFALAALGVYARLDSAWAISISIILFVVFAAGAMLISFLMIMTNAGIMVGGERWVNAAHDAFRFLRRHWLISIEMIGLVFLVALGAAAAVIMAVLVLLVPFTLILLAVSALHAAAGAAVLVFVYELAVLALVLAGGAALAVFEHAAWALLYVRLSAGGAAPKLERLWQMIKNAKPHVRSRKR